MLSTDRKLHVFLCHASQDKPVVRELYQKLAAEGWIEPWLDKDKILPGQQWQLVIEEAVECADTVIVFLSNHSVQKEGFVQRELRYASVMALEKPESTIFLIPVRLEDCPVPRSLRDLQWTNYFEAEKDEAYRSLLQALELRHQQVLKHDQEIHAQQATVEKVQQKAAEHSQRKLVAQVRKETEIRAQVIPGIGDKNSEARMFNTLPPSSKRVELLVKNGKLAEAAETALALGLLRSAVDLFKQTRLEGRELDALLRLQEEESESWVYERIAELGHKTAHYANEAEAWEKLGNPRKAAEAYFEAARQAEQAPTRNSPLIGKLYQRAREFFAWIGLKSRERECEQKIIQYLALPSIMIETVPPKAFIEEEFNRLELIIRNVGYDIAFDIQVQVAGGYFETSDTDTMLKIGNLAEGEREKKAIQIRPKAGQVGAAVPLRLEWHWQDRVGNSYQDGIHAEVPVRREEYTRLDSTPQIINIGAYAQGDQLVGDRLEIHRGEGLKISTLETRKCPQCGMANKVDAKFCVRCVKKLI